SPWGSGEPRRRARRGLCALGGARASRHAVVMVRAWRTGRCGGGPRTWLVACSGWWAAACAAPDEPGGGESASAASTVTLDGGTSTGTSTGGTTADDDDEMAATSQGGTPTSGEASSNVGADTTSAES